MQQKFDHLWGHRAKLNVCGLEGAKFEIIIIDLMTLIF